MKNPLSNCAAIVLTAFFATAMFAQPPAAPATATANATPKKTVTTVVGEVDKDSQIAQALQGLDEGNAAVKQELKAMSDVAKARIQAQEKANHGKGAATPPSNPPPAKVAHASDADIAKLFSSAIPADVITKFKGMDGRHLGKAAYSYGRNPTEVKMGRFLGAFATEPEAINAARVIEGTEVLKPAKGADGKGYYGIFEVQEFAESGRYLTMDNNAGRFAIVERDKVAEEKFATTLDVKVAIHQSNAAKDQWPIPALRRYDTGSPVNTELNKLPEY